MRRARVALLCFALLVSARVGSAVTLRCADVPKVATSGYCAGLEGATRASTTDPIVQKTLAVWRRVEGPVRALTGRETAVVVLAESAVVQGRSPAPAAYLCPGAPPTIHIPWSLLARVYQTKQYPEDFLAFVIGHELGHRLNDLTVDGCQLAAFQRPGQGKLEEALADGRGAFFAAVAGYSTRAIASADLVTSFLDAEFAVRGKAAETRRDALLSAVSRMDDYEHLFQMGLAFAFGGSLEVANRLLAWADELTTSAGVPLPELSVLRALVLTMAAAPAAPAFAGSDARIGSLRCEPVFPAHSALWERPRKLRRSAGQPIEQLRLARRLLEAAEALGANDLVVDSGLGCVELYLGNMDAAARAFAQAEKRVPAGATGNAARDALGRNSAALALLAYARTVPLPALIDGPGRQRWTAAFAKAHPEAAESPRVAEVLAILPTPGARLEDEVVGPTCASGAPPIPLKAPSAFGSDGSCPTGATRVASLPPDGATSGTTSGFVACRRAEGSAVTHVRLPATTDPAYGAESTVVSEIEARGTARSLSAWSCACALTMRGASDQGGRLYMARCKDERGAAAPALLLATTASGEVERVIAFGAP